MATGNFADGFCSVVEFEDVVVETEPAVGEVEIVFNGGGKFFDLVFEVVAEIADGGSRTMLGEKFVEGVEWIGMVSGIGFEAEDVRRLGGDDGVVLAGISGGGGIEPDAVWSHGNLGEPFARFAPR